jgi:hypothetical protein
MNEDLDRLFVQGPPPDAAVVERMSAQLSAAAKPVRPLPSNAVLWAISLAVFAAVSFVVAWAFGLKAISALSGGEMAIYYGVVLLFAGLFARAVTERMIPGEKRFLRSSLLWVASLAGLSLLAAGLFSDHSTLSFVSQGIPCLRLGVIGAFVSGLLGWRLLQRGYLVSPRETLVLYGFFAGLVGVAVLALHCPIRNALHVLVWHLGAMLLAGLVGLILGRLLENRRYAD